jgi:hypothetical protein
VSCTDRLFASQAYSSMGFDSPPHTPLPHAGIGLPAEAESKTLYLPAAERSRDRPSSPSQQFLHKCDEEHALPLPVLAHLENVTTPTLNLKSLGIGSPFTLALAEGIARLSFLEVLDLTDNRMDARSAEKVFLALRVGVQGGRSEQACACR